MPDRYIRPVIAFAIFASGLKYVGLSTDALGWTLFATAILGGFVAAVMARWERGLRPVAPARD